MYHQRWIFNQILLTLVVLILFGSTNGFTYFHCSPSCDINNMSKFSFYQHMTPHFAPQLPKNFYFGKIECVGTFQSLWECHSEFELNWWSDFSLAELYCPYFQKYHTTSVSECRLNLSIEFSDEYLETVFEFKKFQMKFSIFVWMLIFPYLLLWNIYYTISSLQQHKYSLFESPKYRYFFIVVQLIKLSLIFGVYCYIEYVDETNIFWLTNFRSDWLSFYQLCFFVYPVFSALLSVLRFEIYFIKFIQSYRKSKVF